MNGKVRACHADILIPQEHICEHGVGAMQRSEYRWDSKLNKALWRGSSTGFGTSQTNHRARVVRALINSSAFDVGLSTFVQAFPPENELLKPPVEMEDWTKYKYIIHLDGNSYADIAATNSAVVAASIFEDLILRTFIHNKHCLRVPVDPERIADALEWLRIHEAEAKALADSMSTHFFHAFTEPSLIAYATMLLNEYAKAVHYV